MCAKRYHRKSKLGCSNCRQRRIKCDETPGGCLNCQKRSYACSLRTSDTLLSHASYIQYLQQHASLPSTPTEPHFTNALLQQGILDRLPRSVRPHAGRLLEHFASDTVTTMGFGTTAQQAWCIAIPDLATKHDFVVHGALAVAALHVSTCSTSAEAKEEYRNLAALEFNTGLRTYMTEMRKISSDNVEALFAFSTAISLWSTFQGRNDCRSLVASGHPTHKQAEMTVSEAVQVISRCLRVLRGVQVILIPGWSTLQGGPLRCVVQRESWSAAISVSSKHLADERRLKILESMWSNPRRAYEDHFDVLRQTWQDLCQSFRIVWSLIDNTSPQQEPKGPSFDWTSVFHFAVQCSLKFASLLDQQCIEAWVLVAHYAILHAEIGNGLWWLDDSAANLVATAAMVIGTSNWEWIAWPAVRVGTDLEKLRPLALNRPVIRP